MPPENAYPANILPYAAYDGAFTDAELDAIEAIGDRLTTDQAGVIAWKTGATQTSRRITRTAWMGKDDETGWIYERLGKVAVTLNDNSYHFDLRGFSDRLQYSVYASTEGGHYDWHTDQGPHGVPRKLSLSLQLTDPSRYEGCELQLNGGYNIATAPRERGTVIAFPSYVVHRVTPAISGTRKAVVAWCSGPPFK